MKKIVFLKNRELNQVINEELQEEGVRFLVSFSEETSKDVILKFPIDMSEEKVTSSFDLGVAEDKGIEVLPFERCFECVNKKYNAVVKSFDVYELGDEGEGFAFNIE